MRKKRFTETGKWADPWFRNLEFQFKLFWIYLVDVCDDAGVWEVDMAHASFSIGKKYYEGGVEEALAGRIEILPNPDDGPTKWFIPKFIEFQYKRLKENHNPHNQAWDSLRRHGLLSRLDQGLPLACPSQQGKDKESLSLKEDKGGVGEKEENNPKTILPPTFGVEQLMTLWNVRAHANLPRVQILSRRRESHAKARIEDFPDPAFWEGLIEKINASSFLTGQSTNWKCDFDWILNSSNLAKIMEGSYVDNEPVGKRYQGRR